MNINHFEPEIEEKILARGANCFSKGSILDFWSEKPNQYNAVVDGSIRYDVEICLDEKGEIIYHYCDCPYDWGEYCKHEVAVLLTVREHLAKGTMLKQEGQKYGLRAMLSRQSKDDLVKLLCELADEHDLREAIVYHLDCDDDYE